MPLLRAGIVPYLNMFPLVRGLADLRLPAAPGRAEARIAVQSHPPSVMSALMDAGELDIGMVPCGALVTRPGWRILRAPGGAGSMIGANGPVLSVLVLASGPPETWRTLHPDAHSRSSNALIQILIQRAEGLPMPTLAEPVPLEGWEPPARPSEGEAWVLIGTRALRWSQQWRERGGFVYDMGEAWTRWTGLPFTFAVWAAREGLDPDEYRLAEWMTAFEALKHANMARLPELLRAEARLDEEQITLAEAEDYLTRNIRFDLDAPALEALARYAAEGAALGIFPPGWSIANALR